MNLKFFLWTRFNHSLIHTVFQRLANIWTKHFVWRQKSRVPGWNIQPSEADSSRSRVRANQSRLRNLQESGCLQTPKLRVLLDWAPLRYFKWIYCSSNEGQIEKSSNQNSWFWYEWNIWWKLSEGTSSIDQNESLGI